jgi:nitrate reductase NapAB chaperone NapD
MDERERMRLVKMLVGVSKAAIAENGRQAGVIVLVFNEQGETTLGSTLEHLGDLSWLLDNAAEVTSRYCELTSESNDDPN